MTDKKLGRREFLKLMAGAAAGSALAACQPQIVKETVIVEKPVKEVVKETVVVTEEKVVEKVVTATPASVEPVELTLAHRDDFGMPDVWENECLPYFQETRPHINVSFTSDDGVKLLAALVAGAAPDILAASGEGLPNWAVKSQLLNIQPYMDRDLTQDDIDDWDAAQLAYFHRDEAPVGQFGLPMMCMPLVLFYNVDIFDEMGVDYPPRYWKDAWDHDQYAEAMRKLVKKDASGKVVHWGSQIEQWPGRVWIHVYNFGGGFVDPEDDTHCLLGEPEAQAALWWIYDRTWKDGAYVPLGMLEDVGFWETFWVGKTAMTESGPWALQSTVASTQARWNVAPFVQGPVRQKTMVGTDGSGIWSGTKYPEEAWELLKFVTGPYFQDVQSRVQMLQPGRKSSLPYWYSALRQKFPILKNVDLEVFGEAREGGLCLAPRIYRKPGESSELWYPAIESVMMLGNKTPDYFKEVAENITSVNREE